MPKPRSHQDQPASSFATLTDLRRILGDLDGDAMLAILNLSPTIADLENAALCANGQADLIDDAHRTAGGVSARLCDILAIDDDDKQPATRAAG